MALIINVKDKVAQAAESYTLVCGNSDYIINFNFDEEWNEHDVKTARFRYAQGGLIKTQDVVFTGTECAVPVLTNTLMVEIGVYAGDLRTTTPCTLFCQRSILCGEGIPEAPAVGVYLQILKMIEEGRLVGPQGPEGPQGPAGSIKFIVVNELPTEGIDRAAIYMKRIENAEGVNFYEEYIYVDGAWEPLGIAQVEVDLTDYVKKTDYATGDTAGLIRAQGICGLEVDLQGICRILQAQTSDIDAKSNRYRPITAMVLDYAVKKALADCKLADTENAWTEEEQAAARELLGAVGPKDFATQSKAGLVRAYSSYGTLVNANGIMSADNRTLAQYQKDSTAMFIGKGTLENIKSTYIKEGLTANTETLTPEEQAAAQTWLGIAPASANADGTLTIQLADGTKYTVNATKI